MIKHLIIKDKDGNVIHHYIVCKRKKDNTIGYYDVLENKFVPQEEKPIEENYIECADDNFIDTHLEYKPEYNNIYPEIDLDNDIKDCKKCDYKKDCYQMLEPNQICRKYSQTQMSSIISNNDSNLTNIVKKDNK